MEKNLLVLVSGSSGVGKNTIIAEVLKNHEDFTFLRSCTTREKRVDDKIQKDGKPVYHFLTKEEFENKIKAGEMLEYDIFSDNYYGVSKDGVIEAFEDSNVVLKDITVKGVVNSRIGLKDKINIVTIFLTLRKSILKKRLKLRQTKNIRERMKHYAFEQSSIPLYDYCIENMDRDLTLKKFEAILKYSSNNRRLMLAEDINKFSESKVEKIVKKLKANKKVPYIKVVENGGEIYIVKGINIYIASLLANISVTKMFVESNKLNIQSQDKWDGLLKQNI